MSFFRGVSQTFISQGLSALFQLLTGIVTARYLSLDDRGLYSLVFSVGAIAANIVYLGQSQATVYFRNRENVKNSILIGNTLFFLAIQSLVVLILWFFLPDNFFENVTGVVDFGISSVVFFLVVVLLADILISGIVLSHHLFSLNGKYISLQNLIILCVSLPIMLFSITGESAIIIRVLSMALLVSVYWFVVWNQLSIQKIGFDGSLLIEQLRFGSRSFIQNLIGILNYRIILALLGIISSLEDVALFSVALLIVEALRFIPNVVGTVLLPKLTTLSNAELTEFSTRTLKIVMLVNSFITPILIIFSELLIVSLFGDAYHDSVNALRVMLLGAWFGSVYQVLTRVFTSQAKQKSSIVSAFLGLSISVIFAILLMPEYGVLGAGIGFLFGNITTSIVMIIMFHRNHHVSYRNIFILSKDDIDFIRKTVVRILKSINRIA